MKYTHRDTTLDRYLGRVVVIQLWNDKIIRGRLDYDEKYDKYYIQTDGITYMFRKTHIVAVVPYMRGKI